MAADALRRIRCNEAFKTSEPENKMIDPNARVIPRIGLREDAFRRMEGYMASACAGTVDVVVANHLPKMKPQSFITAFNEARKGFRDYGYHSSAIPAGYDLMKIKPQELDNGNVRLSNTFQDEVNRMQQTGGKVLISSGVVIPPSSVSAAPMHREERVSWINKDKRVAVLQRFQTDREYEENCKLFFHCDSKNNAIAVQETLKTTWKIESTPTADASVLLLLNNII